MNLPTNTIPAVQGVQSKLFQTVDFSLPGGFIFAPTYLEAGLIVFLLFLLILTFGSLRHRFNSWTMNGVMPGITFGFVLALFVEAILIASGSTILISVLGWKNPPKPISNVLDSGKSQLVRVLGASDTNQSTQSSGETPSNATIGSIMNGYQDLSQSEQESLRSLICKP